MISAQGRRDNQETVRSRRTSWRGKNLKYVLEDKQVLNRREYFKQRKMAERKAQKNNSQVTFDG